MGHRTWIPPHPILLVHTSSHLRKWRHPPTCSSQTPHRGPHFLCPAALHPAPRALASHSRAAVASDQGLCLHSCPPPTSPPGVQSPCCTAGRAIFAACQPDPTPGWRWSIHPRPLSRFPPAHGLSGLFKVPPVSGTQAWLESEQTCGMTCVLK